MRPYPAPHLALLFVIFAAIAACAEAPGNHRAEQLAFEHTNCGSDEDDDDDGDDDDDDDDGGPSDFLCDQIVLYDLSERAEAALRDAGFERIERRNTTLLGGAIVRLRTPSGMDEQTALQRALELAPGARGDLNHVYTPQQTSACAGVQCATFTVLNWPTSPARCGDGLRIGLIDTPVDRNHPALRGASVRVLDVLGVQRRPAPTVHGTAMASLMVGSPDGPAPGLAPRAHIVAVNAFHADARGNARADAADLVAALDRLSRQRIPVINLSLAGPPNAMLEAAIAAARARGATLVAAVGNEARARPRYPAAYPGVIGVTAIDQNLRRYRSANTGATVDFAAPGVGVIAATANGGDAQHGTSHAAALASVVLARHRGTDSHEEGVARAQQAVRDLGSVGRDDQFGFGLLQAGESCR